MCKRHVGSPQRPTANLEKGPIALHLNSLHVRPTMESQHDLYTYEDYLCPCQGIMQSFYTFYSGDEYSNNGIAWINMSYLAQARIQDTMP